jgi:hypothetical protein
MHTLSTAMIQLFSPFALFFSERIWRHAQVLVAGTILASGKGTVSAVATVSRVSRLGGPCSWITLTRSQG